MNTLPPENSTRNGSDAPLPAAMARGNAIRRGPPFRLGDGPPTPASNGAIVKMQLTRRTNTELRNLVSNHIVQMDENPNFPDPQPAPPVLSALFTAFETDLAEVQAAKTAYELALTRCDMSRGALLVGMQARGAYVQAASNGNTQVIMSSGLDVRRAPSPVGRLPSPANFRVELSIVAGLMKFRWDKVKNARGYILESSPDVTPRVFTQFANTTKTRFEKELPTGETFVFRLAAFGGSTGLSYYSAELIRGAA